MSTEQELADAEFEQQTQQLENDSALAEQAGISLEEYRADPADRDAAAAAGMTYDGWLYQQQQDAAADDHSWTDAATWSAAYDANEAEIEAFYDVAGRDEDCAGL